VRNAHLALDIETRFFTNRVSGGSDTETSLCRVRNAHLALDIETRFFANRVSIDN
jgi:hypothetical protein